MKNATRLAAVLAILALASGCGGRPLDPKAEGHNLPIEIVEEGPVPSPGVPGEPVAAEEESPSP